MKTAHDLVAAAKSRVHEVALEHAEEAIRAADVLIDVREADEYQAGHIPGAIHASRGVLEFKLNLVRLSGPVRQAGLYGPASSDRNAVQVVPIDVPFYADRSTVNDGVTLTEQQAREVLAGLWYVNVLTEKYPDGEIRGQIVKR